MCSRETKPRPIHDGLHFGLDAPTLRLSWYRSLGVRNYALLVLTSLQRKKKEKWKKHKGVKREKKKREKSIIVAGDRKLGSDERGKINNYIQCS